MFLCRVFVGCCWMGDTENCAFYFENFDIPRRLFAPCHCQLAINHTSHFLSKVNTCRRVCVCIVHSTPRKINKKMSIEQAFSFTYLYSRHQPTDLNLTNVTFLLSRSEPFLPCLLKTRDILFWIYFSNQCLKTL